MRYYYKIIITALSIILVSCSNSESNLNTMGFKGNVKSVLIKKFDATEKNGNIEKTDKSATEISILNFDTNNNLIESIIYNSDKSSIKELKKYN